MWLLQQPNQILPLNYCPKKAGLQDFKQLGFTLKNSPELGICVLPSILPDLLSVLQLLDA